MCTENSKPNSNSFRICKYAIHSKSCYRFFQPLSPLSPERFHVFHSPQMSSKNLFLKFIRIFLMKYIGLIFLIS